MKKTGKPVMFLNLGVEHNVEMLKAAQLLADARTHLLYAKSDLGGRREGAIEHINSAVDELRAIDENGHYHRHGQ